MADTKVRKFGSTVIRDFIPANENPTATEIERSKQLKALGAGRVRLDFIPPADFVVQPPSGSQNQGDEAIERSLARQATAARTDFQAGVKRLAGLNVAQTIDAITLAPSAVAEMLLVAERLNGNRSSVLSRFPQVDPKSVAIWESINAGAPEAPERAAADSGAPNDASEGTAAALPEDAKE